MVHDESISDTSNHNIHLQHCDLCALQMQLHLPEPWLWSLSFDDLGEWKSVFVDRYRNPLLVQRLFIRPLKQAPPWV
ncbi:MAG: hypothetical protein Q4D05_07780, partial [Acinetobacter sp.]|nr:hypothetical protein [Acinetobacter sp.]